MEDARRNRREEEGRGSSRGHKVERRGGWSNEIKKKKLRRERDGGQQMELVLSIQ